MSERVEANDDGAGDNYANQVHVCGSLRTILKHICDSKQGRVLNLLSFPISANAVLNDGME